MTAPQGNTRKLLMIVGLSIMIVGAIFIPASQVAISEKTENYESFAIVYHPIGESEYKTSLSFDQNLVSDVEYRVSLHCYTVNFPTISLEINDPNGLSVYSEEPPYSNWPMWDCGPFHTEGNYHFTFSIDEFQSASFCGSGSNEQPTYAEILEHEVSERITNPFATLFYVGVALIVVGFGTLFFGFLYFKP